MQSCSILTEDRNLVFGPLGQIEEMYRHSVKYFRRIEHLVKRHCRFLRTPTISRTTRQSTSSNTETIDRQAMECHQSGFDGLPDRGAARREGRHSDRLRDSNDSGWGNKEDDGPETSQTGNVTNLGYSRNYFSVSVEDDPTTTAEPRRASDGNEGTSQNDQVGGTNGGSINGDRRGDEVPVPTASTATTTIPDVDKATVLTDPPTGGEDLGANSSTSNENGSDPTWGPYPGGDDAPSHTGGDETIPDPASSDCKHTDASYHSWNWSLIIYASAGVRMRCRTCGEQKAQAEFSSLLEKSEEGGAKLNWDHISNIRWWPGGAWSWG